MKLHIGNTKKTKSFNNHFKLHVTDMLGDGDSYGDHTTYYKPEDQWQLNFTLFFLGQGAMAYDHTYKIYHEFQDRRLDGVILHQPYLVIHIHNYRKLKLISKHQQHHKTCKF